MRSGKILRFLLFSNFLVLLVFAFTFYQELNKVANVANPINARTTKLAVGATPFVISMVYLVFTYFKTHEKYPEDLEILDDLREE